MRCNDGHLSNNGITSLLLQCVKMFCSISAVKEDRIFQMFYLDSIEEIDAV